MGARIRAARAARRRAQAGFTLVELLVGILLASVFAAALYGFLFSGMSASQTEESQARSQMQARDAITRMAADVRQVSSPDGTTWAIENYSPTSIVLYVDNRRAVNPAAAVDTRPQRVRYRIIGNQLVREVALPIGTTAPYTYGSYTSSEVMVDKLDQGTTPLVSGTTIAGGPMPQTVYKGGLADLGYLTLRLRVAYRNGQTQKAAEYSTDVSPRNPLL